jgi:DNA polymerase III delta prime subunit
MTSIPLLIISGPVGVGKTSAAEEVSNVLVERSVPHTLLDLDCLAGTYPRELDDRFGSKLMLTNLRSVWKNCAAAGSKNLVLARVIETETDKDTIAECIPHAATIVCQLQAGDETLVARVRKREIGTGTQWHEHRSLELAASLKKEAPADFVVDTDGKSIVDVTNEIVSKVSWHL